MTQVGEYKLPAISNFTKAVELFNAGHICWCSDNTLPNGACDLLSPHRCDNCLLCCNFPAVRGTNAKYALGTRFKKSQAFARYAESMGYKIVRVLYAPNSIANDLNAGVDLMEE